jgi:hypothetical protein
MYDQNHEIAYNNSFHLQLLPRSRKRRSIHLLPHMSFGAVLGWLIICVGHRRGLLSDLRRLISHFHIQIL